jgi:hypothetical protein
MLTFFLPTGTNFFSYQKKSLSFLVFVSQRIEKKKKKKKQEKG